jgi:hypothetical protein
MPAKRQLRYDPELDYYVVLGVAATATPDELQRAYRLRAKAVHPDLHPNNAQAKQQFQILNDAYEVVSDPRLRDEYDMQRRARLGYWDAPRPASTTDTPDEPSWERFYVDLERDQPDFSGWKPRHDITRAAWRSMMRSYSHRLLFSVVAFILIGNVCVIVMLPHITTLLDAAGAVRATQRAQWTMTAAPTPEIEYVMIESTQQPRSAADPPPQCTDKIHISAPAEGANIVTERFDIRGSANAEGFWSYSVEIDSTFNRSRWILALPRRDPVAEENGLLMRNVSIGNMTTGDYILRLKVTLQGGHNMPACEIRVHRR